MSEVIARLRRAAARRAARCVLDQDQEAQRKAPPIFVAARKELVAALSPGPDDDQLRARAKRLSTLAKQIADAERVLRHLETKHPELLSEETNKLAEHVRE